MSEETLSILGPAFLAGIFVLASHIRLGRQVLARGIIFIDLAVAQAAATGVLTITALYHDAGILAIQLGAAAAALLMVSILHALEKVLPDIQEALIGGSFVVLASIAVLVSAGDPQGAEHLTGLLNGQILWTDATALFWLGIVSLFALAATLLWQHALPGFYLPFAIAITAAVQVVGVYLVFASLIFPALACRHLSEGKGWVVGMILGSLAYAGGLIVSLNLDLPSGAVIVTTLALLALMLAVVRHLVARRGLIRYNPPTDHPWRK